MSAEPRYWPSKKLGRSKRVAMDSLLRGSYDLRLRGLPVGLAAGFVFAAARPDRASAAAAGAFLAAAGGGSSRRARKAAISFAWLSSDLFISAKSGAAAEAGSGAGAADVSAGLRSIEAA